MTADMKRALPVLFLLFFEGFVVCGGECGGGGGTALCQSPHCNEGCDRFRPSDTCRTACNLTLSQFGAAAAENTLSCLNGCKMAANRFAQRISEEAILQSPRIIPESVTDTAISLLWRNRVGKDSAIRGGAFYLQTDREERRRWKNAQRIDVDIGAAREQVLRVENLVPYERYRFRVAWRLPEAELHSPPSKAARTKADDFGRPSPPILESVRQERRLRVNIAWRPPAEPRGPLAFYRLSIKGVSTDLKDRAEVMMECIYSVLSLSPKGCVIFASGTPIHEPILKHLPRLPGVQRIERHSSVKTAKQPNHLLLHDGQFGVRQ